MPGTISTPTPTLVMPQTLCTAFTESREYVQLRNQYHDGTPQASQLAQSSRRTWKQSRRLSVSQLATLRTFWQNLSGGLKSFLFYDPCAGSPVGSNYDPTGVNTVGRYTCALRNSWTQTTTFQRTDVTDLEIVELAPADPAYLETAGFGPHGAITSATLYILTSHVLGSPSTSTGAMCSIDGLGLLERGWLNGGGAWTLRTDSTSISPSAIGSLEALFAIGTAFPVTLTTPEQFLVYDCWLVVTFADSTSRTMRPSSATINYTWADGTVTNPGNAIDGDTSTCATIERTHLNTLDFSPVLVLAGFE